MITYYGGQPVMYKTGHSVIKNKMKELDCKFGGEMSGHIFLLMTIMDLMMRFMLLLGWYSYCHGQIKDYLS